MNDYSDCVPEGFITCRHSRIPQRVETKFDDREEAEPSYRCEWCRRLLVVGFDYGTHLAQSVDCFNSHREKYGDVPLHDFSMSTNKAGKYKPYINRSQKAQLSGHAIYSQVIAELELSQPLRVNQIAKRLKIPLTKMIYHINMMQSKGMIIKQREGIMLAEDEDNLDLLEYEGHFERIDITEALDMGDVD